MPFFFPLGLPCAKAGRSRSIWECERENEKTRAKYKVWIDTVSICPTFLPMMMCSGRLTAAAPGWDEPQAFRLCAVFLLGIDSTVVDFSK